MIATFGEYIILLVNISFLIYSFYRQKKILRTDSKASEKIVKSSEFFVYLENQVKSSTGVFICHNRAEFKKEENLRLLIDIEDIPINDHNK